MVASGSPTRGDVENKGSLAVVRVILPVAASTTITKGSLVYQDGANGIKTMVTDGSVAADKVYFASEGGVAVSLADAYVHCWKKGAIVIGKAQGAITVGAECRASQTTAGSFEAWVTDTTSATTVATAEGKRLARYIGHAGEGLEIGNTPTDAADAETNCKFVMH